MKKKRRTLSKTPRSSAHSRKVHFLLTMREKISQNWVKVRKSARKGARKDVKKLAQKNKKCPM